MISIIAIMFVALVPAINSLSKSGARKGAISLLLGVFEQARGIALKDGRATYVVFPAQFPAGTTASSNQTITDRYFYHSAAIFEDDPDDPTKAKIQVTEWKVLGTGISLRTEISYATSTSKWTGDNFRFSPISATATFPFLKFNSNGQVEAPAGNSGQVQLRLFEGYVINGTFEKQTNPKNFDEIINIPVISGRAVYGSANP